MYSISPNIDKNKVFIINKATIRERFDPLYYKSVNELTVANNSNYPVKKLTEVVEMKRGRFGHRPRNDPKFYNGRYPFIQTGDVVKASNEGGQIPYSQTLNEMGLKTSKLFDKKAVIITIAANIGYTAVLDYPACFPDSLIAMAPKEEGELKLDYLNVYFKYLKEYLNNLAPQAAQKNINYQQLAPTPIVIPPLATQQEIVDKYQEAYTNKQKKEQEAKEVLASIDSYLLNELGITLPEKDSSPQNRVFNVNFSEVLGGRLDSEYSDIYYKKSMESMDLGKYPLVKVKDVTAFVESGGRPKGGVGQIEYGVFSIGGEHVNENCDVGYGNPKYIPIDFHKKMLNTETKLNDVILVKDGATTGKVGIIELSEFVGCNVNEHVFIIRTVLDVVNPFYFTFFIHAIAGQMLIKREITGATVTGLTKDAIKNINIPLPPLEKQNEIAAHISSLRATAKQLQQDAEAGLERAKKEIEQLILGAK